MAHEHLVKWGKHAFEKGLSLAHIENYLLKRGMRQREALEALHEITAFEHKMHEEALQLRRVLFSIPITLLLIASGLVFLYLAGVLKSK
ncbi:hypothetical protein HYT53_06260 [Candidatus Woesearchaeota archaeon]|nr:hypothetical protein [Candidatus Woesearchaeota archaeon]